MATPRPTPRLAPVTSAVGIISNISLTRDCDTLHLPEIGVDCAVPCRKIGLHFSFLERRRIVRELRHALEGIGIEVWADSERLSGGDPLAPKIQQAIKKADYQIAIISMNGLNSEWVQREIEHAESAGRGIVPLMLPGIGPVAMRRLFRQELVGIPLKNGPGAVQERFPTS